MRWPSTWIVDGQGRQACVLSDSRFGRCHYLYCVFSGFTKRLCQLGRLETLVENQNFRGFTWSHLRWMFTTFHLGHYQPLSWLTFSLDYLLWGMDPFGYHLTNILLHSANAVLFYFLTLRLLEIATPISERRCADAGCGIFRAVLCHSSAAG